MRSMRFYYSIGFILLVIVPSASQRIDARPLPPPRVEISEPVLVPTPGAQARVDTSFLFAASGPGSYGSPGTDARGFTFEGPGGAAESAGWVGTDLSAQDGIWWHVASTEICAGHGPDMSGALPFDWPADPTNDYALWCGRQDVCGWANPTGYGNLWDQHVLIDLRGHELTDILHISFAFAADYEGEDWDTFHVYLATDEDPYPLAIISTATGTQARSTCRNGSSS